MSFVNFFTPSKNTSKEKNEEKIEQSEKKIEQGDEKTKTMNNNIQNITQDVNKGTSFLDSLLSNVKTQTEPKKQEDLEENIFKTKKSKSIKESEKTQSFDEIVKPKTIVKEDTLPIKKSEKTDSTSSHGAFKSIKESKLLDSISKYSPFGSAKKSEKIGSIDRIDFTSEKSKESAFKYSSVFSSIKNTAFKGVSFLTAINFWFIIKILIIIIIISTLGFNIFLYLAEGTDFLQYIINKYAKFIPVGILNTMKMSAVGIRGTAETTENNLNTLQENVKKNKANQHVWEKKNKDLEK